MNTETTSHTPERTYQPHIDGLRGCAVLAVVAYHVFPQLLPGGFTGVDVFFVISGYLITRIIATNMAEGRFRFSDFYSRRVRRIFPSLIFLLAAVMILGWWLLLPRELQLIGRSVLSAAGFSSNFLLLRMTDYFDKNVAFRPLLHLWSLAIEEQFYLLFPLIMWASWRRRFNPLIATGGVAVVSFGFYLWTSRVDASTAFYSPTARAWEIMVGASLSALELQRPGARLLWRALSFLEFVLGASFIVFGFVAINGDAGQPGWLALFPTIGTALVIHAGTANGSAARLLSGRPLVAIGKISYPLYLWHWPILSFALISSFWIDSVTNRLLVVVLSLILAALTDRVIERPLRFGAHAQQKVWGLAIAMGGLAVVGWFFTFKNFPSQFPEQQIPWADYTFDFQKACHGGTCFLSDEPADHFQRCPPMIDPKKPTLLLWGDSFAAHLIMGYEKFFSSRYNIVQRTASGCPPLLESGTALAVGCKEKNVYIFDEALQLKPEKIVLAGDWDESKIKSLRATLRLLRRRGFRDIDVIGAPPKWSRTVPYALYAYCREHPKQLPPDRFQIDLAAQKNLEAQLKEVVTASNAHYRSTIDVLCDDDGCLASVPTGSKTEPTAWDEKHFTRAGSEYVVSMFLSDMR